MLLDGRPDETPFRPVIGDVLATVRARAATGRVRVFGEMVSLLWEAGRQHDAARLEQLWNSLLHDSGCSLYCAYRIDLFDLPEAPRRCSRSSRRTTTCSRAPAPSSRAAAREPDCIPGHGRSTWPYHPDPPLRLIRRCARR